MLLVTEICILIQWIGQQKIYSLFNFGYIAGLIFLRIPYRKSPWDLYLRISSCGSLLRISFLRIFSEDHFPRLYPYGSLTKDLFPGFLFKDLSLRTPSRISSWGSLLEDLSLRIPPWGSLPEDPFSRIFPQGSLQKISSWGSLPRISTWGSLLKISSRGFLVGWRSLVKPTNTTVLYYHTY